MADFSKTTNFTAKDALTSGDPNKVIKGSEFDTEFNNLATASATKANKIISGTSNAVIIQTAGGDLADGSKTLPSGALVGISDTQTLTNKSIDSDNNTITNIVNADIKAGAAIDAAKLADGSVSNTEYQYLNGVTSAIQTQIDSSYTAGGTDVAVADGGTGSSTAAGARTNLGLGTLATLNSIDIDNIDGGYSAGSYVLISSDAEKTTANTSYVKVKEIDIAFSGTYTIDFEIRTLNPAAPAYGRIYVNGVAVGTQRSTTSTVYVSYSENITISSHDLIQIYIHTSGANTAYMQNFRVKYASGSGMTNTIILA